MVPRALHVDCPSAFIPHSPLVVSRKKRTRLSGNVSKRTQARKDFALNPARYRSIRSYVPYRKSNANPGKWKSSAAQMSRDMMSIFGKGWAVKRGGGGRGRGGGKAAAEAAPGLHFTPEAQSQLGPGQAHTALSYAMEYRIVKAIRQFEDAFGTGIITRVLIESIATNQVLSQLPELQVNCNVDDLWQSGAAQSRSNVSMRQLTSVSRFSWMRSFLSRQKSIIKKATRCRALERHKTAENQIELVLTHLRNVYQAEAFAQIQRYTAECGHIIPGFVRFEKVLQREFTSSAETPQSLLEIRDGLIYVKALQNPLVRMSANFRFALDETPIVLDSPLLKVYTTGNRVSLSRGRASIWTLLPVLCGNGNVIASLLLQRCQSLRVDLVKFTSANNFCVASTENAQQTNETWLKFASTWLNLCGTSWRNPGIIFIDGHSSHITRAFIQESAKYGLHVVIDPCHTSMLLQVAGVGINRFLKSQYALEYTASMCASNVTGCVFDDVESIGCVVRAIRH